MNKQTKQVTKADQLPYEKYSLNRRKLRKNLIDFKKKRRIHLGPYATLYFECYENQLISLDISNNIFLTELWCNDNQLTSLDVQ